MTLDAHAMGRSIERVDAVAKVSGTALYAYDHSFDNPAYAYPVLSTIARGRVSRIDIADAESVDGVLAVLHHDNAPRLAETDDQELSVLQSDRVAFRGQVVGAVVAESREIARYAAGLMRIEYEVEPHDTQLDRPPESDPANADRSVDVERGTPDAAFADSAISVDRTYTTPMEHNNAMEPHVTVARWDPDGEIRLTMYDSTQGVHVARTTLAPIFGLPTERIRVIAPHVGGGFGSKGLPHAHDVVAGLCARAVPGRPVKLALTRQQMFSLAGHRTPTIQRVRLGSDSDGRLNVITHDVTEHTSTIKEFAEQSELVSRMMYAAPNRRTSHRLVQLDVPVPSWMRAPGECPGSFALEVAMDEMADACGLDPIEFRVRNEPERDPHTDKPWSSRRLVECLERGRDRFGWAERARPGSRREGRDLIGLGVAGSTYPLNGMPGSRAAIRYADGRYRVSIGAVDIGTGARTALMQIAADSLGCAVDAVEVRVGDTDLPKATVAGGSSGLNCWGSAIVQASAEFRQRHGVAPRDGAEILGSGPDPSGADAYAVHSFGAQFAEVRVDMDTGEAGVSRMLGVFAAGRIVNERTARSQFVGGMTMGLSMALHEHGVMDPRTGHVINHDLAQYHIATNADVRDIEAEWFPEPDLHSNPMGAKGIGEIGIVGAAAAVANAVYNATGVRVRDLPITPDQLAG